MIRIVGIWLFCVVAVLAQNSLEKVTVPLYDPSRPAQIRVHLLIVSITVKGADIGNVQVEARSRSGEHTRSMRPPGTEEMKRLDMNDSGLDVIEDNNIVTIKTMPWRSADLFLTVPRHSSLQLNLVVGGNLSVEGLDGEIDADDLSGNITLRDISGAVVAHSLKGQIQATFDRIDPSKPTSFSTMNGISM
jgi:hypothetical protein